MATPQSILIPKHLLHSILFIDRLFGFSISLFHILLPPFYTLFHLTTSYPFCSKAIEMDIVSTRQPLDPYYRRILREILEVPRTPLAAYLCRELKKSLEIKHAQQNFNAIRSRIRANRRHVAMVDRNLGKRLRSGWDSPCQNHLHRSTPRASHNRPVTSTKTIIKGESSDTETERLSNIAPHLEGTEGHHSIMVSNHATQGQMHRCSADEAVAVAVSSSTPLQSSTTPIDPRVTTNVHPEPEQQAYLEL